MSTGILAGLLAGAFTNERTPGMTTTTTRAPRPDDTGQPDARAPRVELRGVELIHRDLGNLRLGRERLDALDLQTADAAADPNPGARRRRTVRNADAIRSRLAAATLSACSSVMREALRLEREGLAPEVLAEARDEATETFERIRTRTLTPRIEGILEDARSLLPNTPKENLAHHLSHHLAERIAALRVSRERKPWEE